MQWCPRCQKNVLSCTEVMDGSEVLGINFSVPIKETFVRCVECNLALETHKRYVVPAE